MARTCPSGGSGLLCKSPPSGMNEGNAYEHRADNVIYAHEQL
jgi:hypothetical protein